MFRKKVIKKFVFMILIMMIAFLGNRVDAASCDSENLGCAVCTYQINTHTFEFHVKATGLGTASVEMKHTVDVPTDRLVYNIINNTSSTNFINKTTNKLQCPAKMYYKMQGGGMTVAITIDFFDFNGSAAKPAELLSQVNNDKELTSPDAPMTNNIAKSCVYNSVLATGNGTGPDVTIHIMKDGTFNYEVNDGYVVNNVHNITTDYFKDQNGNYSCKSLYMSCGSNGSNKFCTFSEENVIRPGTESGGEEAPDAEDVENGNNSQKPDTNLDIEQDVDADCAQILGDVLDLIQDAFDIIKIAAPILLIFFGSLDFAKAVIAGDDKATKKATSDFMKRTIAAVLIFFIPFFIQLIFSLPGIELGIKDILCGISKVVIK